MGDEFYSIIKLVSGEEVLSLVAIDDNDGDSIVTPAIDNNDDDVIMEDSEEKIVDMESNVKKKVVIHIHHLIFMVKKLVFIVLNIKKMI